MSARIATWKPSERGNAFRGLLLAIFAFWLCASQADAQQLNDVFNVVQPTVAAPAGAPPGLPEISARWAEEVRARCTELHPDAPPIIPGSAIPECSASLANLACRFEHVVEAASAYADVADAFPDFGGLVYPDMCRFSAAELQSAFEAAMAVEKALGRLARFLEEENGCAREVVEILREMGCGPGRDRCDAQRESALALAAQRLDASRQGAGRYRTAMEDARDAQRGIVAMSGPFRAFCGS